MSPAFTTASSEELGAALNGLMLSAAPFLKGRGLQHQREALRGQFINCSKLLKAKSNQPAACDAEALIQQYLDQGGNWRELVAAVSRNALDGSTRK